MKTLYNQVKRDQWAESDVSMPVIARYGTGGQRADRIGIQSESRQGDGHGDMPHAPGEHGIRGGYVPMIVEYCVNDDPTPKVNGGGVCYTLSRTGHIPVIVTGGKSDKDDFMHRGGQTSQTLDASYYKGPGARNGKEREVIATEPTYMSDRKGHNGISTDGVGTTLTAQEKERPVVGTSVVRRLTPLECERLQGFPDNWSKYGMDENGKVYELSDSARYKLQGNSIARPFWTYLLRRIAAQYERPATLGSLFDGQAGFPLCWKEVGGIPLWSSEIEKHAQAVARYHFPEDNNAD